MQKLLICRNCSNIQHLHKCSNRGYSPLYTCWWRIAEVLLIIAGNPKLSPSFWSLYKYCFQDAAITADYAKWSDCMVRHKATRSGALKPTTASDGRISGLWVWLECHTDGAMQRSVFSGIHRKPSTQVRTRSTVLNFVWTVRVPS